MAKSRKNKKHIGNYVFLFLLVSFIINSTIMLHSAKVVDVAADYINMKEIVESKEFLESKKQAKKGYEEDRNSGKDEHTLRSIFNIDDDTPYEESIAFIYNYIDVKSIDKYIERLCIFYVISVICILLSVYLIVNKKKYLVFFLFKIIGIVVIEMVAKSSLFSLSFLYLPILGLLYYLYNLKVNTSN